MKQKTDNMAIDFVINWVDDSDSQWQEEYFKYKGISGDQRSTRFKDMGTLKYLFRGIEKFTPWVNKIYFVTCGQHPSWLNLDHPKLVSVDHKDYIPSEYLPTFSSHTIELNLHRILGLSEHFVHFDDDTFIVAPTDPQFFFKKGLPCDIAVMGYNPPIEQPLFLVPIANAAVINRNFDKKTVIKQQFRKFYTLKYKKFLVRNLQFLADPRFPGFRSFHIPSSLLKSSYDEVWNKEYDTLNETCLHKFRVLTDVNQWLIQNWQICLGKFVPRNVNLGGYVAMDSNDSIDKAVLMIQSKKYNVICANDVGVQDYQYLKKTLGDAFEHILPEKSSFEI